MRKIKSDELAPMLRFARQNKMQGSDMVVYGGFYTPVDHRLLCCTEGSLKLTVEKQIYTLNAGSAIYIPSGFKYRYHAETVDNCFINGYNFDLTQNSNAPYRSVDPPKSVKYNPEMKLEDVQVEDIPSLNNVIFTDSFQRFHPMLELIIQTFQYEPLYFREKCSSLLKYLLLELSSAQSQTAFSTTERIINFIQKNFAKPITNESISKELSYHPHYLNRVIKNYTGTTLHKYLQRYRINKAIEFLNNKNLSISQISERVGFETVQHFCIVFKKITGHTPSSYRSKQMKH